ncbi:hypothetical protein DFH07DRAFT_984711 [Mycena maculata]|uniref:Uncharacterized protein n=1 Tax=Mycena maculata TaxID=230809 RepID=A0AAD7NUW6_9AGAR|nr:hypothetical protein DFH07DRAFT_984711 [Mycena maculata]
MNRSVNVQRSASQSPPVTPPRRAARPALSPKNTQACRPNDAPVRRHPTLLRQQSAVTPQTQSLGQANARLIHERLQQSHSRLQVQLHARSPAAAPPPGTVKAFLDTTFRSYASRFHAELNNMRTACMHLVQREHQQTAQMRNTCARLVQERDVAEEKLRVLLERRAHATAKRTRAQVEREEEAELEAELEATGLLYPPSPVLPPQFPTQSPPPRLLSPFVLAAHRSPSHTPDPEDRTGFDLTVACDALPRPCKKRRVSESSERTLVKTPSPGPDGAEPTKERQTCPPAAPGFGECDMDLESDSESDSGFDTDADEVTSPKSQSRASSTATSRSPPPEAKTTPSLRSGLTPPPPVSPDNVRLDLEYVDIMYLPVDGKLVCRVCLLAATGSKTSAPATRPGPVHAFVPGASWDMLRSHCEEAHPEACRDVVNLGKAGVCELRRRLGLGTASRP